MVVVAEVMDLEHAPDFEQLHDAVVMVDVDAVHVHALFGQLAPSVVAMVLIDLLDTVRYRKKEKTHSNIWFYYKNLIKLNESE